MIGGGGHGPVPPLDPPLQCKLLQLLGDFIYPRCWQDLLPGLSDISPCLASPLYPVSPAVFDAISTQWRRQHFLFFWGGGYSPEGVGDECRPVGPWAKPTPVGVWAEISS